VATTDVTCAQDAWQGGLIGVPAMRAKSTGPRTEEHAVDPSCRTGRPGEPEIKRMSNDNDQTKPPEPEFDFSTFPRNTLFHDRRTGGERRSKSMTNGSPQHKEPQAPGERRAKKERRRRIDPTTFDKQYSDEEMEFMNAIQRFKEQSGTAFPSYGEILKLAVGLGYRLATVDSGPALPDPNDTIGIPDPISSSGT
jgi:hypothetical protein